MFRDFTTVEVAQMLTDVHGAPCRSSRAGGCRCIEHGGIGEVRGEVVELERQCDGSMTCRCQRCAEQRLVLASAGPRAVRQPWEPELLAA